MDMRLELFVTHLPTSLDFYSRVLGFRVVHSSPDGYTSLVNGNVRLGLNARTVLERDQHPIRFEAGEQPGKGVELVLEVEDVAAVYAYAQAQNWPISSDLRLQAWGLTDFRVLDPDGYYWRITSR
jgi:catechol 2,3-dioxygenase-like lactoylglutathione lyase family enzyme